MSQRLEVGEKVLILDDGDIPSNLLPVVGYVRLVSGDSCIISSDPSYQPVGLGDVILHGDGEDQNFFSLSFFYSEVNQTEEGRRRVVRYSERGLSYPKGINGLSKFIRKVENQYKQKEMNLV